MNVPEEAIRLILEAGGIPVLAHPGKTNRDDLLIMSQGNPPIALQLLMVNAALVAYWFYRRTRTRKRTAPPPSGWTLQVMFLAGNLGVVMLGSRLSF